MKTHDCIFASNKRVFWLSGHTIVRSFEITNSTSTSELKNNLLIFDSSEERNTPQSKTFGFYTLDTTTISSKPNYYECPSSKIHSIHLISNEMVLYIGYRSIELYNINNLELLHSLKFQHIFSQPYAINSENNIFFNTYQSGNEYTNLLQVENKKLTIKSHLIIGENISQNIKINSNTFASKNQNSIAVWECVNNELKILSYYVKNDDIYSVCRYKEYIIYLGGNSSLFYAKYVPDINLEILDWKVIQLEKGAYKDLRSYDNTFTMRMNGFLLVYTLKDDILNLVDKIGDEMLICSWYAEVDFGGCGLMKNCLRFIFEKKSLDISIYFK